MSDFDALNSLPHADAVKFLSGLYEHSDWIVDQALSERPFTTIVALESALKLAVDQASINQKLALICAHPPLTGKAKIDPSLAADSQSEQSLVGLDRCSPEQFVMLNELNQAYTLKFGWPFILAVKGPRGNGLSRQAIIDTLRQRIQNSALLERQECLGQIHRIAQLRLRERLGIEPSRGRRVQRDCESLTRSRKSPDQSVDTRVSGADQARSQYLCELFLDAGFDSAHIDARGNAIGRYHPAHGAGPYLLTGSSHETANGEDAHEGYLGVTVPIEVVRGLKKKGLRLNLGLEVVALSEANGVPVFNEYLDLLEPAAMIRASALCTTDVQGIGVHQMLSEIDREGDGFVVHAIRRDPSDYWGFVGVRVEQGSVLKDRGLALGLESLKTAQLRLRVRLSGRSCQSDTNPMDLSPQMASATAAIVSAIGALAKDRPHCAIAVSELFMPEDPIDRLSAQCTLLLDVQAASEATCAALAKDVMVGLESVCKEWGLEPEAIESLQAPTALGAVVFRSAWSKVTSQLGLEALYLPIESRPSAQKMNFRLPQAFLVLRRESHRTSNDPLDSITSEDLDLAVFAFEKLCFELQPIASARS